MRCAGVSVITTGVLGVLTFNPLQIVRSIWNIIFGSLMIMLQFNFTKTITR